MNTVRSGEWAPQGTTPYYPRTTAASLLAERNRQLRFVPHHPQDAARALRVHAHGELLDGLRHLRRRQIDTHQIGIRRVIGAPEIGALGVAALRGGLARGLGLLVDDQLPASGRGQGPQRVGPGGNRLPAERDGGGGGKPRREIRAGAPHPTPPPPPPRRGRAPGPEPAPP